jgi:TRAP-type C4-dicarboxylate transport system permease small subunit
MRPAVDHVPDRGEPRRALFLAAARVGAILHWVLGVGLLIVVGINVINAMGRYLFGYSITGADELMVYAVVWMVMAGAIISLANRDHISVNLLPTYATGRFRRILHIVHDLAAVLACSYATYASYGFLAKISRLGTTSMGLGIPMSVPHMALLVGFAGLTLTALILLALDVDAFARNSLDETAA